MEQTVEKRPIVCLILRRDCVSNFPISSKLLCCITLDANVFSDLQLFVQCWLKWTTATSVCWLSIIVLFICCALPMAVIFVASWGAGCTLANLAGSTLSGILVEECWRRLLKVVNTDIGNFVLKASYCCCGTCLAIWENLTTGIWNGCKAKILITPLAANVIWRDSLSILCSTVLVPDAVVIDKMQCLLFVLSTACCINRIWCGLANSSLDGLPGYRATCGVLV